MKTDIRKLYCHSVFLSSCYLYFCFIFFVSIYLILHILSRVPLYPECFQVPVLLVYFNMERSPRFSSILVDFVSGRFKPGKVNDSRHFSVWVFWIASPRHLSSPDTEHRVSFLLDMEFFFRDRHQTVWCSGDRKPL